MDAVNQWVRNIVFYIIGVGVIYQLLPGKEYHKYMKYFTSIILVLLVLSPLTGFFHLDEKLEYYFQSFTYRQEASDFSVRLKEADEQRYKDVLKEYETMVENNIEAMAAKRDLYLASCDVMLEEDAESAGFGSITGIRAAVTYKRLGNQQITVDEIRIGNEKQADDTSKHPVLEQVRQDIMDFYSISEEQVTVVLQE